MTPVDAATADGPGAAAAPDTVGEDAGRMSIADLDIAVGGTDFSRSDLELIARVADELGIGTLFLTESTGRDSFTTLGELAVRTTRIGLGTGIVNVFSRTPTAIATATATLLEMLGERHFSLGLGTSGKQLMQRYHGVDFARPVTRLAETVRIVDHVFRTGNLPADSAMFPMAELPLGLAVPARERLTIYVAGLSGATLEIAGRCADGWLPIWVSAAHGAPLVQEVLAAAAGAGRPRPRIAAVAYGGVGETPELVHHARSTLAWYVAANGTAYRRLFERYGYGPQVDLICELWAAGQRARARDAVPDDLLHDTTLLGSPEAFYAQVRRLRAIGVDRPVLRIQGQLTAAQAVAMLARLASHDGSRGPS